MIDFTRIALELDKRAKQQKLTGKKISQLALAHLPENISITDSTVSLYLNGKVREPSFYKLAAISETLGIELAQLISEVAVAKDTDGETEDLRSRMAQAIEKIKSPSKAEKIAQIIDILGNYSEDKIEIMLKALLILTKEKRDSE